MENQEDQTTPNESTAPGAGAAETDQDTNSGTSSTNSGHKKDPVHNTGDERMMIDEEGVEIKPDDQV